jgi:hypothetical protein
MRKPSRTTKSETASPQTKAGLTLNDLDVVNALLEPRDYMLMVEDDGALALYRIARGAGYGGYDRYERV